MKSRTTCRPCPACDAITPHSTRPVALRLLWPVAFTLALGSALVSPPLGLVAAAFTGLGLRRDLRQRWNIACERCRWHRVRASRPEPRPAGRPVVGACTETVFL